MVWANDFAVDQYGNALVGLSKQETATMQALQNKDSAKAKAFSRYNISKMSPKALKLLVRDGIPAEHRPAVWLTLSGGRELQQGFFPDYCSELLNRAQPEASVHVVEIVVGKWMPGHQMLTSRSKLLSVARVALAYCEHSNHTPEEQLFLYTAFLVSVVGVIHLEEAFWILAALLEKVLPSVPHTQGGCIRGALASHVLEAMVEKRWPGLSGSFAAAQYSLTDETTVWFANLFIGILPGQTTARVWDSLLCEGIKVLYRIALTLLMGQQKEIYRNIGTIFRVMWRIRRTFDADGLLKAAFKGLGPFPMAEVKRLQVACEEQEATYQAHHAKRLEALLNA